MEVAILIDDIKSTFPDEMILRFPHIVQDVFKELDNKSLANCRNVSRACCDFIADEKFYWIRKIKKCVPMKKFRRHWKKVLKNTPTEDIKEIFVTVKQFAESDLNKYKNNWSPLHITAAQGHLEFCKYIIEKIKDPNPKRRKNGVTAFHLAAHNGHKEICELMIDNLEDKNPATNFGMTPFHYASKEGHFDVCKLLIQNIEDKNPAALDGCTPLHLATKYGHLEIVRLIVETGVDKRPLFKGKTPLDLVKPRSRYCFFKLLVDNNSQIWRQIDADVVVTIDIFLVFYITMFVIWTLLYLTICKLCNNCPVFPLATLSVCIIVPAAICMFIVATIWVYLSGCIHNYMNLFDFWFGTMIAKVYPFRPAP